MSDLRTVENAAVATIELRDAVSAMIARAELADRSGRSFNGKRDIYTSLGYRRQLTAWDFWDRYKRGGIAKRIVETFPKVCWRGGAEIVEDEDPDTTTEFEQAWIDLNTRLKIWSLFKRVDTLAGLGHFAVILLGAPGNYDTPLTSCTPQDLKFLNAFPERDVLLGTLVDDPADERYGYPEFYSLQRVYNYGLLRPQAMPSSYVHWTRVVHVPAEDILDHPLLGIPKLQAVWNYLDDLTKCVGGGSEAFWKRIDGGKQFKLDPTLPQPTEAQKQELHNQIEEYTHELRRILTTRGVDIQDLGSAVGNFGPQVSSILDLIAATTGIPQRILMGAERGELASTQDQSNFDDAVMDRRDDYCEEYVARPFVDRMIALGVLPEPAQYHTRWPEIKNLNDAQRMALANNAALLNKNQGEIVVQTNEIRSSILGFQPFTPAQEKANAAKLAARMPQKGAGASTPGSVPQGGSAASYGASTSYGSVTSYGSDTARPVAAEVSALERFEQAILSDDLRTAEQVLPLVSPTVRPEANRIVRRLTAIRTLGDLPGHVFHGNQWTGGEGSGPTSVIATSPEAAQDFINHFEQAFKGSDYSAFVTHYKPDDILKEKMTPILMNGGKTGMLVHDHGDGRIEGTALFNTSDVKGAGLAILKKAIEEHGVNYAEAYGPKLPKLYEKLGFKTTEQYPFDKSLAAPDWNYEKFSTPDYHIMHLQK